MSLIGRMVGKLLTDGSVTLITPGKATPFSYDAQSGSITMVLSDALESLKGKSLRALVWATDKAGKRIEASWVFKVPEPQLPVNPPPAAQPSSLTPAGVIVGGPSGAKSSPR